MSAIVFEGLSRRFGETFAVRDVSLTVAPGEFVTLLGPSGCGKTTTLRMVAGLEQATSGRISIAGEIVSDAERGIFVAPDKRRLGMVFQSYAIWPHMTVFDNVAYPLTVRRRPKSEIAARVGKALDLVEMTPYADRPAPQLSGGQQQRVAIARAIVFEPSVLLLDEPLSNLDARLRAQMGEEFRALQQRIGFTALYVTHDQEEAMAMSDRIVVMHKGTILQTGAPEAIYQRPASRDVAAFFGAPNLFDARVASCSPANGGLFAIAVEGKGFSGTCRSARATHPGDEATVVVRPEALRFGHAAGDAMRWSATVTHSTFRGARRTLTLSTPSGPVTMETPALMAPAPGAAVEIAVVDGGAWAIVKDRA